ncbi:MAG TPA: V-type ATP synthase subunit B, partial [Candidatus Lokiarchaeia archaeon]
MKDAIGKENTREDHADISSQLLASYSKALEVRDLMSIIGEDGLNSEQLELLRFGEDFEKIFINQDEFQNRDFATTLNISWKVLSRLSKSQLYRIHQRFIDKYYIGGV